MMAEDVSDGVFAQVPDASDVVEAFEDLIFRRGGHLGVTGQVADGRRQIS